MHLMHLLLTILYFIIVLTIVVFVHEFGHFFVAKRSGVKIVEFAIGMGPKLFGFKDRDNCQWNFRVLPIGGYVQMYGDDNATSLNSYKDNPTDDELKFSLQYKHPLKKIAVAFAGPFMNFVLAFVLFFAIFSIKGKPMVEPVIYQVVKDSYADKAGILVGDKIVSINGKKIESFNDIVGNLQLNNDKQSNIEVLRNNQIVKLKTNYKKNEIFGIKGNKLKYDNISILSSLKYSASNIFEMCYKTGKTLWNIVVHQSGLKSIGGPIAIAKESVRAGEQGIWSFIYFISLISVMLGAANLIPIPVLDGGQVVISFYELIFRRRISNFVYKILVYFGFGFVAFLMSLGFINDLFINR